jgi:hypothetical protein
LNLAAIYLIRAGVVGNVFSSFYAACDCGKEYRCGALPGETCGDVLEAMARIAPSQPNEALVPCPSQSDASNGKISLNQSYT